jgi:N-methylhydantoinase B
MSAVESNVVDLPGTGAGFEAVTAEIMRKALLNLTNEMASALIRTSGSPVVFEVKDFCTCFLDCRGDQLSYSSYALLHAGASLVGTRATIQQIAEDRYSVRPGDGWILNDPFKAGSAHQGDIAVLTPVFHASEHLGWCFTSMHVMDVGGTGVSGYAPGARVFYDEGLLFPPTRMISAGKIDPEWERFISANVRLPGFVMSDIRSMMAANNVGQKKLQEIVGRFGIGDFKKYSELNKDLSERALRRRIEKIPDGVYKTVDWIEFDGHGGADQLFEVRTTLEVKGSDLNFHFDGAPQQYAFVNAAEGQVKGNAISAILTMLCYGDLPFNAGVWRPLHFDLGPVGTVVNAVPPAAMSNGHTEAGFRVLKGVRDVLSQALSLSSDPILKGRVAGQPQDGFAIAGLTGLNQHREPTIVFLLDSAVGSGGGAQSTGDGQDVYFLTSGTGAGLAQVETHESRQPILFLWRSLAANSGGPGFRRGGQSIDEAYLLRYSDELFGSATNSCAEVPPRGFGGGMPASTGDYWPIHASNAESLIKQGTSPLPAKLAGSVDRVASKTNNLKLTTGDVLRLISGGGGGLGDPIQRDPAKVAQDVRDGYITAGNARSAYGVIVGTDGTLQAEATVAERQRIRERRIGGAPSRLQALPRATGISVEAVGEGTSRLWACGYCGSSLCQASDNWRTVAKSAEVDASDYYRQREMHVRPRKSGPMIKVAERCCPHCAGLLSVDVFPAEFAGFEAPRLR